MPAHPNREDIRTEQWRHNWFNRTRKLGYPNLEVDGQVGPATRAARRRNRFYLGIRPGESIAHQSDDYSEELVKTLWKPRRRVKGFSAYKHLERVRLAGKRQRARRKALKSAHRVGGVGGARALAVARRSAIADANGVRHSFYSQSGAWTVKYAVKGEPRGFRSDCSQWFTSCYFSAGLRDPNGLNYTGGYTGTLGAHGTAISRSEAMHTPGAAVLFGAYPHHHVEMAIGDGTTGTYGHGSTHVDRGTFDLLPGPKTYRKYN